MSLSFVLELPVTVAPGDERVLLGRFEAGRRLYNVLLQEALKRLALLRESKAWLAARKMDKGAKRTVAFKACQAQHGFSEYALHALAAKHKNAAGFADRMSANELQKLATRVWKAVEEHAFGKRGRPRFKGAHRPLHSLEGKTNKTGIRWQVDTGCVIWNGIYMPARLPTANQDPYAVEALKARTKYIRLVWRMEKGRRRWFAQLVQEGEPPQKYEFGAKGKVVGLDIGPSTMAVVADAAVALERFTPGVEEPAAEKRRLQRALDRSRRANNPGNYNADGTVKKGARKWHKSKRYQRLATELAEQERRLAATRKKEHGTLANKVLGLGNLIQTEKLSYKAFQRCFGRSVKNRAPGAFIELLTRKASSAGGKVVELDTWRLRMSQYDHLSGMYAKKPLSQRWHPLGASDEMAQRDCYSAWLAQNVQAGEHNPSQLEKSWPTAEPLLRRAGLLLMKPTSGRYPVAPTVAIPSESVARRRVLVRGLNRDAVSVTAESPKAPCTCGPRTCRLYACRGSARTSSRITRATASSARVQPS